MPVQEGMQDTFSDVVLNGKLVFYQKGMVFVDQRFHAIVMPYDLVSKMTIYQSDDEWWLEVILEDKEDSQLKVKDLMPHNMTVQNKMYLRVDQKFYKEKFYVLEKLLLVDEIKFVSKMTKSYDDCPVANSQVWLNFLEQKKFNEVYSTDFMSLKWNLKQYEEYMEFNALHEFNRIKNKEFIAYPSFSKVYREADQQAGMPDSKTNDLVQKLLAGTNEKTSVVIVSGIPGSGKGRAAEYLAR